MRTDSRRLVALVPALAAVAFVCATATLMRPEFITNDDVTLADFAAHGYPARYFGVFLTGLLHVLYTLWPAQPWFGLTLYALNALALSLWFWLLWRVFRPWWLAAALALASCGLYLRFLVYIDYTAVSAMLGMASLCWACLEVLERRPAWRLLFPGLVFMLGMWVRPQGSLGALAYGLPIVLWTAWLASRGQPWRQEWRRLAAAMLLFLAPAAAGAGADLAWRGYTLTPQQASYEAFNAVRGRLHALPRAEKALLMRKGALLASLHWTPRDLAHFFNWSFLDERVYTTQALQTLLDHAPASRFPTASIGQKLRNRISIHNPFFLMTVAFLPLLFVGLSHGARPLAWGLLLPAYGIGLTVFMVLAFSFIYRIEAPYAVAFGLSLLIVGAQASQRCIPPDDRRRYAALAAGLLLVSGGGGLALREFLHHYGNFTSRSMHLEQKLQDLDLHHAGDVILIQAGPGLELEMLSPLRQPHLDFQPIQLGWSTFSPRFYQQLNALGVTQGYQAIDAMVDNEHAFLLGNLGWCRSLLDFASRPSEVQVVDVQRFHDGTHLCRLQHTGVTR